MKRQVFSYAELTFDESFKQMAIELSHAKGSVKIAAQELGIDPGRLSKWRQNQNPEKTISKEKPALTAEQLEIRRLQKELKEAQLERDIWSRCYRMCFAIRTRRQVQKRRSASFPRETANLQVYRGA